MRRLPQALVRRIEPRAAGRRRRRAQPVRLWQRRAARRAVPRSERAQCALSAGTRTRSTAAQHAQVRRARTEGRAVRRLGIGRHRGAHAGPLPDGTLPAVRRHRRCALPGAHRLHHRGDGGRAGGLRRRLCRRIAAARARDPACARQGRSGRQGSVPLRKRRLGAVVHPAQDPRRTSRRLGTGRQRAGEERCPRAGRLGR